MYIPAIQYVVDWSGVGKSKDTIQVCHTSFTYSSFLLDIFFLQNASCGSERQEHWGTRKVYVLLTEKMSSYFEYLIKTCPFKSDYIFARYENNHCVIKFKLSLAPNYIYR